MADTYSIVTQYPTVEFIGGTQTQDVSAVGILTKPHGVYAEFRVPQAGMTASIVNAAALGYADIYETLFTIPGVVGVAWSQQANAVNVLQDVVTITVASTSGNSTATLSVPLVDLGPQLHKPQIAALRKTLNEIEAS